MNLLTVVETPEFIKQVQALWDESVLREFINFIAQNPTMGDLRACARITSLFRAHFGLTFGRFVFQKNAYIERLCAHFSEKQNIQI